MKNIIMLIFILICSSFLFAHGTKHKIISKNTYKIQALFEANVPISKAKVFIFPPLSDIAVDTLFTDSLGIFYFTPSIIGEYSLMVNDGHGHGTRINILHSYNNSNKQFTKISHQTTFQRILMILLVLWGAFGTFLYTFRKIK